MVHHVERLLRAKNHMDAMLVQEGGQVRVGEPPRHVDFLLDVILADGDLRGPQMIHGHHQPRALAQDALAFALARGLLILL